MLPALKINKRTENYFDRQSAQFISLIQERMAIYEDTLWSGVAAIHSHNSVLDHTKWKVFSEALKIEQRYPGINGIGVIHRVNPENLETYLAKERVDRPGFSVRPKHQERMLLPITYVEPLESNMKALGLDMAHETNRFTAAVKSEQTGEAKITGPITLVQDEDQTPGFLFYVPFYNEEGGYDTVEEREENFVGLVYAPFIFKKLMLGTLDEAARSIGVEILDDGQSLYSEHVDTIADYDSKPLYKKEVSVEMYGRTWTFDIWSTLSFKEHTKSNQPMMILISGIVINALLLTLFLMLARSNRNAIEFAHRMASNYQEKSEHLEETNSELEEVNAHLEEFSYRTSHDLRAPIMSTIGLLDIAEQSVEQNDKKTALQSLTYGKTSLQKLKTLVEDLLMLTKASHLVEENEEVNLEAFVTQIIDHISHMENFEKLEVIKNFEFSGYLHVKRLRLELVVENLITNAIKYYDPSEAKPMVRISTYEDNGRFVLEVEDNGLGIEKEHRGDIFSMFKRFHPKISYGSGLGLYMVYKSAKILDGEISYADNGRGSTFTVKLPM